MTDTLKKLRIFAASPSDVASERAKLNTVVEMLKPLADAVGVALEVVDWRQVVPNMGRPQQEIFNQLKPDSWDLFVGILWHRFGTPPGGKDKDGKEFLSGTEEEFKTAYELWKQYGKPRIMMYRCTRAIDPEKLDPDQFKRVKEFFAQFDAVKGEHPGLYQSFDTTEAFVKLVLDNLQRLLLEYREQTTGKPLPPETVQAFAPKIPDNLPRRQSFFGRKDELSKVLGALSSQERGWGVVIDGIGGIGKTALAIEVAYRCKELEVFDAFVFVSAKKNRLDPSGITELSAISTLDEFVNETARVLGNPGIAQLAGEGKRRALLDALRVKRALLIYDNLETLSEGEQKELADWLRFLPQNCKAILTSRRRGGEGALWLRLEKLDWIAARDIIADEAKKDHHLEQKLKKAGEVRWQELFDETKGSPLALVHVLGLMRTRTTLSFDGALELLRGNRDPDLQKFIFLEARKELGTDDLATLRALSLFVPSAPFDALMQVAELSRNALQMSLDRLDALSLLDKLEGEERYALHPLTRAFVRDELLADANVARETGMRFAEYWTDYAKRYGGENWRYKTFDRLGEEWANLETTANWLWKTANVRENSVGDNNAARMLIDLERESKNFLWLSGRWDEKIHLSTQRYEISYAIEDWNNAGWGAYSVADTYYYRNSNDNALLWSDRSGEMWLRMGTKREQVTALLIRGKIAWQGRDFSKAKRFLHEALAGFRSWGMDVDIATALNELSGLAIECQDFSEAEKYCDEVFELTKESKYKEEQAVCFGNFGKLQLDRKQWADARKWFEQELTLGKEVGRVESIGHAQYGLARAYEAEGHADLALPLAQEALKIYERLQHRDLAETRGFVERLKGKS